MSFYNLGNEVHTTETYSKIADAIDEKTAIMLVDILNAKQQSAQEEDCPCGGKHVPDPVCKNCGLRYLPK